MSRGRSLMCSAGLHPLTGGNVTVRADGERRCLACQADNSRRRREREAAPPVALRPPEWMDRGLCAGAADPDMWFPEPGRCDIAAAAARICARCPVRAECLGYALDNAIPDGIWGGLAQAARRRLAHRLAA